MKVLIATTEMQGTAPGDYSCTLEGELVTPVASECASNEQCGCIRGFPGLVSSRATTTAMVVERSGLTVDDVRDAVTGFLERGGWVDLMREAAERADVIDVDQEVESGLATLVHEHVETVLEIGARFSEGTVIARSGSTVYRRSIPQTA